jgi:cellulose synthase/poly-beta-1,6-N-acetylglucosamine synthase-like glycosyltransferase
MLSIVCAFRNSRNTAINCLRSMLRVIQQLGGGAAVPMEVILIDDASDADQQIPALLAEFRGGLPAGVKVTEFLFKQQQHYTRNLAYGFSAGRGKHVLFVSHDMMLTADYVRTLTSVAGLDPSIGLVRGTSPFVDGFQQHRIVPPFQLRTFEEIDAFAKYVSDYHGLRYEEDPFLTGDSMLIKREVFDKIGVFDPRYFGYFGDIDFGLRLQRAGFKMVCAKGAWLWHEGAAAYRDEAQRKQQDYQVIHAARMQVVNAAYRAFREKWDPTMPAEYSTPYKMDFDRLRALPAPAGGEFVAPLAPPADGCQIR